MKAEQRKHLETNTLVEGLGKLAHGFQQGFTRSFWLLVGGIVVVGILIYVWNLAATHSQQRSASLWYKWNQLDGVEEVDKQMGALEEKERQHLMFGLGTVKERMDLERLEKFAQENGSTVQGRLARFQLARLYLYEGSRDLGQAEKRSSARGNLEKAATTYAGLIKEARDIPVLHQEAMLNCAKARESLGDIDEARKLYQQLSSTYPKSSMGELAGQQVERLEKESRTVTALDNKLKVVPPDAPPPTKLPPLPQK